jgi:hypothetical protein
LAYPLNIMVIENRSVARAPAVWGSGRLAIIICAKELAKRKISMQKSNMRP